MSIEQAKIRKLNARAELLELELANKKKERENDDARAGLPFWQKTRSDLGRFFRKNTTIQNILGIIGIAAAIIGFFKALDEYKEYRLLRENEKKIAINAELVNLAKDLQTKPDQLTLTFLVYYGKSAIPILLDQVEAKKNMIEIRGAIQTIIQLNLSDKDGIGELILLRARNYFEKSILLDSEQATQEEVLCEYLTILRENKIGDRYVNELLDKIEKKYSGMKKLLKTC